MPKIHIPVIGYTQGGRQMMTTAMSAVDLVSMVTKPKAWDPATTSEHGNRARDTPHMLGIVNYLETVPKYVIGCAVVYLTSKEASFEPTTVPNVTTENDAAQFGVLSIDIGARFDIGDGQHRIGAYEKIVQSRDEDDPLIQNLRSAGQPLIIVIEDDPKSRAQDFADLQRNVKPPTASLGQSMDRRQPINNELSDLFTTVPLLVDRVEYSKDNPGKLSAKLFSFKTIRYVSGLLLVGNGYRSPATMDKAVNACFEGEANAEKARKTLKDFWTTLGELVRFADVIDEDVPVPELREATYLTSAGVLYAIAYAVHQTIQTYDITTPGAVRALDDVSFDRAPKDGNGDLVLPVTAEHTIFAGTLINAQNGKLEAGRTAWEGAGMVLYKHIKETLATD
ncbi:DNA sulfur modification protein DndB [Streptomyces sp. AP-93]|uniref:DNA sulfur modification protein DndB n=1 Tax=Streptomyces sp. AP-93 TaxID=2929048 RepID=UPI001FAEA5EA|nr:DNA sulfur modification protein DndB [Streptomyces sp. AP-93]MCJ0868093.1 DNA sulfur modification protein DndB [Streptomyces sp. AP-93]